MLRVFLLFAATEGPQSKYQKSAKKFQTQRLRHQKSRVQLNLRLKRSRSSLIAR
jgi:hypothetical protein